MKVWRVVRYGAPTEAMEIHDLDDLHAGAGQLRIRVHAAALNLNDSDMCRGIYPSVNPPLPFSLGMEVTGIIDEAGPGLEEWLGRRPGQGGVLPAARRGAGHRLPLRGLCRQGAGSDRW